MKNRFIILILLLNSGMSYVYGHALWIETPVKGKINTTHEVKIFYGEYADGEIELLEGWYSDVKSFSLWLINPTGEQTKLICTAHENHFTTSFIPDQEGIYTLAIGHSAKDLGDTYIYQFNTSTQVYVGKVTKAVVHPPADNEMYVVLDDKNTDKPNTMIKGRVIFQGKPAANVTVTVDNAEEDSVAVETDENGIFNFKSLKKGKYMLEASATEDKKGEHHGKPYEHIWRCATILITIK